MMKILVTGGAGFVGSHTVDLLVREGHQIRVLDCLVPQVHGAETRTPRFLTPHLQARQIEFHPGDVRDAEALRRALQGMEAVLHLAAVMGVGQSMYRPVNFTDANATGTASLLEVLANEKTAVEKLVLASSMSLYGEGAYRCSRCGLRDGVTRPTAQLERHAWEVECPDCRMPMEPAPTPETKPPECTSVYAITKKCQEEMVLCLARAHRIPAVALRYFNVYGPRQSLDNPYTGVAAIFLSRLLNGKAPIVFEDGHQTRDFIHVSDIARANALALTTDLGADEVLNIGTGEPTSVIGLAETLAEILGLDLEPSVMNRFRAGDIRHCIADTSRMRAMTGFTPRVGLREGLIELANFSTGERPVDSVEQSLAELESKGMVI